MADKIPSEAIELEINGKPFYAVNPITAESSGWIDQENADRAVKLGRLVIIEPWCGHVSCVVGYLDVEAIGC